MKEVRILRSKYDELLNTQDEVTVLTPSQMLLMGFNGLFTQLDADFTIILDQVAQLNMPDTWRKVDVIREARALQVNFQVTN